MARGSTAESWPRPGGVAILAACLVLLACLPAQALEPGELTSAPCTHPFRGRKMHFQFCVTLDAFGNYKLAWNVTVVKSGKKLVRFWFQGRPEVPYAWAGWGISETGLMNGSNVLVGYANKDNTKQTAVRPFHLAGILPATFKPTLQGDFQVVRKLLAVEFLSEGALMRMMGWANGLLEEDQTVIWRGGLSVQNFKEGILGPHRNFSKEAVVVDFNTGDYTPYLNGTLPSDEEGGATTNVSGNCGFTFQGKEVKMSSCINLDAAGQFRLAWTTQAGSPEVQTLFVGKAPSPNTWAGWGVSPTGEMPGTNSVLGYVDGGNAAANVFYLAGKTAQSVTMNASAQAPMQVVGGSMQVEVLEGGSVFQVMATVTGFSTGPLKVIWAGGQTALDVTGSPTNAIQGYHGPTKGVSTVDPNAGTSTVESSTANVNQKVTHAWLAGLGFGFLLPIGILVARHLKVWMDPAWFYTHIGIQFCGYLLGVIGWGYGIWLHMQSSADVYPMSAHYGIGVTIFVTSTLQMLTPIVKPNKGTPVRLYWNLVHWGLGYITVILAIANIFLGFQIMKNQAIVYGGWQTGYIIFIAAWGALMLLLEPLSWYMYFQQVEEEDEDEDDEDYDDDEEKDAKHHRRHDDDDDEEEDEEEEEKEDEEEDEEDDDDDDDDHDRRRR